MPNQTHLNILNRGVSTWNEWRVANPTIQPDLRETDLSGWKLTQVNFRNTLLQRAFLYGAELQSADISEANLDGTDLRVVEATNANFKGAHLRGANCRDCCASRACFSHACLQGAIFNLADLQNSNIQEADISETNFTGANLSGTNFRGAHASGTIFGENDLSRVEGLETLLHSGPSIVGIPTIHLAGGNISLEFLRGAGVPENFIVYMASLAGTAFEFYSCFISYSTKDQNFADRLYADLQAKGVRCWFAPHDIQSGKKLHDQIDHAIRIHEKVLLILSPDSMSSEWVRTEIAKARKREMEEQMQVLFPIRLVDFDLIRKWECFDADTGKDSARELREYFIPDFSNWTDAPSYQTALERLLKDLRGDGSRKASAQ
jgi:hypothetical protein